MTLKQVLHFVAGADAWFHEAHRASPGIHSRLALAFSELMSPADLHLLPRQIDSVSQCHDGDDFNCNSILHKSAVLIHALF
jgi:hypothetical protein